MEATVEFIITNPDYLRGSLLLYVRDYCLVKQ